MESTALEGPGVGQDAFARQGAVAEGTTSRSDNQMKLGTQRVPLAALDAVPCYHDLRDAFGQPGCPFCRLLTRRADRYLDSVLWELVNDPELRSELNLARGYCQQHGWLLVRAGSALGVAILSRDVVKTLLEVAVSTRLENRQESVLQTFRRSLDRDRASRSTANLVAGLSPQVPCPACAHLESTERDCMRTLLDHLDEPGALSDLYRASDGLCLAHFRGTLARAPSVVAAEALVSAQTEVWQRLHAELGEFIRKKDARFRDEPFGDERDAWRRALESISGARPRSESERQGLTGSI